MAQYQIWADKNNFHNKNILYFQENAQDKNDNVNRQWAI